MPACCPLTWTGLRSCVNSQRRPASGPVTFNVAAAGPPNIEARYDSTSAISPPGQRAAPSIEADSAGRISAPDRYSQRHGVHALLCSLILAAADGAGTVAAPRRLYVGGGGSV